MNKLTLVYNSHDEDRIDRYLISLGVEDLYSRSYVEKLITDHRISVNKKEAKKSHRLKFDDIIDIEFPDKPEIIPLPEQISLEIVYEDEYLSVINKQAGITVHPAPGNKTNTVVNALINHYGNHLSTIDPNRPGIVHRLDKDTSGLLLVARDNTTHIKLVHMFRERLINKYYKAIVTGVPANEGTIELPIDRYHKDRKRMTISENGRYALTNYELLKSYGFFSLLNLKIETGRTHQIRIHLKSIGFPILGDAVYNSVKATLNRVPENFHKKIKFLLDKHLKRQALHAYRVEFNHPITQQVIELETEMPDDMKYVLKWLDKNFIGG